MPILVELPRICLSSLVNVCFPKRVDSHMHVRFARPSFASDIDNLSVTAVPFVTGTDWNHSESDESHESGAMDWKLYPSLFVSHVVRYLQRACRLNLSVTQDADCISSVAKSWRISQIDVSLAQGGVGQDRSRNTAALAAFRITLMGKVHECMAAMA